MSCWTSHKVSGACIAAALVLAFLGGDTEAPFFLIPALVIVVLDIIQYLIFFRCPHCGRLIRTKSLRMPRYCARCGEELLPPDRQDRRPDW